MLGRYPLGVMQGRLLAEYKGRYQAHPVGYWRDEFEIAADLGLELIEFILDFENAGKNPLLAEPEAVLKAAAETGVEVRSICADYFMEAPIQRNTASAGVLDRLIANAASLGVRDVVIPCVDQSSLNDDTEAAGFAEALRPLADRAGEKDVNLSLETDLAPGPFVELLERIGHAAVSVNYDTGNSAALGFDPAEEFAAYGNRITDIHIKDRALAGGPVMLGDGACDFQTVFGLIAKSDYDGPLIMQAYRDDEGLGVFKRQKDWLEDNYGALLT